MRKLSRNVYPLKLFCLLFIIGTAMSNCGPKQVVHETLSKGVRKGFATDPLNATYWIEGQEIRLVNGRSEVEAAPGSATTSRTLVFGNPVYGDLDGDGVEDSALLLVHDPGGSGTFYYAAASLRVDGRYRGTNALLLGDRVAPENVGICNGVIVVNYAGRGLDESMTTPPSVGKSKYLTITGGKLIEIQTPGDGEQAQGIFAAFLSRISGYEWKLVRLAVDGKDMRLERDSLPTLAVDGNGRVQGLATLNRYFGQMVSDKYCKFRWEGPLGSTMMSGPENLMNQESAFLNALEKARRISIWDSRLVLQDESGRVALEFGH